MSDLHDRFEKLARRGTPRGADAVLAAAGREADAVGALTDVADPASADDGGDLAAVIDLQPIDLEAAPIARRRRRRSGPLVAAGGVAATLFVGILAIGSFVGSGGGSDSPEGAVRQLAAAVAHGDPLAAADVLAPEEVRSLDGTVNAATKRAQELTLVQNASAPLSGLDLSVDNLNLSTQSLGDGYAKVIVDDGTISARTNKPEFSPLMQKVLRDSGDNSASADLSKLAQGKHLPTFVVTVQHDGHWYVSVAYTALEYIREANQLPAADFGSGVRAEATLGADSPDAAVTDALQALSKGDWSKLISLAPPDEIPVYDYRAAILQLAADSHPSFAIDKVSTTSTVNGDTAKVKLTASGTENDGGKWSLDGSCFTGPPEQFSIRDEATGTGAGTYYGSSTSTATGPASTECGVNRLSILPMTVDASGNGSSAAITVVKEDGRWFVSPVGTVLDLVDQAIADVTQRDLYELLNVPQLLPPDGALTLGKPVSITNSDGVGVYTLSGHQGERLLGLATSTNSQIAQDGFFATTRVFGPDGKEVDSGFGMLQGEAAVLPTDGTYTVVIQTIVPGTTTVTIWDEADAPDAAKHPPEPSIDTQCLRTAAGVTTCTDIGGSQSSSATTSTSVPGG